MDRRQGTRLSKFLSLVLRHRPDDYGLEMDDRGSVDLNDLIDVLVAEDILADDAEAAIQDLVEGSERRRFAIENGRMRALYGHSARVRLSLPEHDPPDTLYHGTTFSEAQEIRDRGLRPAERAHVHLSGTREEAVSVGRRHTDTPVLLEIDTTLARESGVKFSQASDVIWLSGEIPLEAIRFPELPEAPPPAARPVSPPTAAAPSAAAGVHVADESASPEFRRRTRKKSSRR
jgi:putative RNA 2'-phosphotransferase